MDLAERFGRPDINAFLAELGEDLFQLWWARDRVVMSPARRMAQLFSKLAQVHGCETADDFFGVNDPPERIVGLKPDATAIGDAPMQGQSPKEALRILGMFGMRRN